MVGACVVGAGVTGAGVDAGDVRRIRLNAGHVATNADNGDTAHNMIGSLDHREMAIMSKARETRGRWRLLCNGSRKSPPQPEAKMRFLHPADQMLACSTSRDVNKPSRYSAFPGKSALGPRSGSSRFFQSIHHKHRFRANWPFLM